MNTEIKVGDEIVIKGVIQEVDNSNFPLCVEFENFTDWVDYNLIAEVNGGGPHDEDSSYKQGDEVRICANVIAVDVADENFPLCIKIGSDGDVMGDPEQWINYNDIVSVNGEEFNPADMPSVGRSNATENPAVIDLKLIAGGNGVQFIVKFEGGVYPAGDEQHETMAYLCAALQCYTERLLTDPDFAFQQAESPKFVEVLRSITDKMHD